MKKRTEKQRKSLIEYFKSCARNCEKAGIEFSAGTDKEALKTALNDDYKAKTSNQNKSLN